MLSITHTNLIGYIHVNLLVHMRVKLHNLYTLSKFGIMNRATYHSAHIYIHVLYTIPLIHREYVATTYVAYVKRPPERHCLPMR